MKKMGYTNIRRTLNGTGKICIYLFTKALPARTRLFLRLVQVLVFPSTHVFSRKFLFEVIDNT